MNNQYLKVTGSCNSTYIIDLSIVSHIKVKSHCPIKQNLDSNAYIEFYSKLHDVKSITVEFDKLTEALEVADIIWAGKNK